MVNVFEIKVYGLDGMIFQTKEGEDRYSFQLGGYYNWHCPLHECIQRAEDAMKNIFNMSLQKEVKCVKRISKKLSKLNQQ